MYVYVCVHMCVWGHLCAGVCVSNIECVCKWKCAHAEKENEWSIIIHVMLYWFMDNVIEYVIEGM